jgi:hypothetical protein
MKQHARIRRRLAARLLTVIAVCFAYELRLAHPPLGALAWGFLPDPQILRDVFEANRHRRVHSSASQLLLQTFGELGLGGWDRAHFLQKHRGKARRVR